MREMKDSGIEWIGEIPKEWKMKRMKSCISSRDSGAWGDEPQLNEHDEICLRIADFDFPKMIFKDVGISTLTKRNYKSDVVEKLLLRKGDILIEKSGGGEKTPVGRTVIFDKEYRALYANFMDRLRCSSLVIPKFMQYIFVTFYKNDYTRNYIKQTTGIQNLDLTSMLVKECVPLCDLVEQQLIVDFLDAKCAEIDNVIAKSKDSIEEYKKLKQSVITQAVTKGIRPNRQMKDSGIAWIGEIPDEWDLTKVKYITSKIGSGKTPKGGAETYVDSGIMFLRSQNIYNEGLSIENVSFISESVDKEMESTRVLPDDILLNITGGSIGRCCVYPKNFPHANVNQHVCIIRPNLNIVLPSLLHYMWISNIGNTAIRIFQSGANREGMNFKQIGDVVFPYISIEEQQEIADYLDKKCSDIDELIAKKEQFIVEMENYKKSLIYEYVTGKKEVQ